MNDEASLGIATEIIIMTIVICMILLFVGIVILIIIYAYIAGRALRERLGGSGSGSGSRSSDDAMVEMRGSLGVSTSSSMSREDVEKLPCFDYSKARTRAGAVGESGGASPVAEDDCAVCLDNFKVGDKCKLLPICNHSFHAHCVDMWLLRTPICPICRTEAADFLSSGGGEGLESQHLDGIVIEPRSGEGVESTGLS